METKRSRQVSPQTILLVFGVVIVLAIVVTAIASAVNRPEPLEAGTPEAAVQAFVQAVIDGDEDAAAALLTERLEQRCDTRLDYYRGGDSLRASLGDVDVDGNAATVEVDFVSASRDLFDSYQYDFSQEFDLVVENGEWRISRLDWPHYSCSR